MSTNATPDDGDTEHVPLLGTRLIASVVLVMEENPDPSIFLTVSENVYDEAWRNTNGRITKLADVGDDNSEADVFDMSISRSEHDHNNEYAGRGTDGSAGATFATSDTWSFGMMTE